jgi:hypothetical protein
MNTHLFNDAAPLAGGAGVHGYQHHDNRTHADRMYGRIVGELRGIPSGDLAGLAEEALRRGDFRRAYAIACEQDRRWDFVRRWAGRLGQ